MYIATLTAYVSRSQTLFLLHIILCETSPCYSMYIRTWNMVSFQPGFIPRILTKSRDWTSSAGMPSSICTPTNRQSGHTHTYTYRQFIDICTIVSIHTIQYTLHSIHYTAYTLHSIHTIQYTHYTVYTLYSIHTTQYTHYTVYTLHSIHTTQ